MIRHYSLNEQGKRAYQEDSVGVFCEGDHGLFAVADGLGGHGWGPKRHSVRSAAHWNNTTSAVNRRSIFREFF